MRSDDQSFVLPIPQTPFDCVFFLRTSAECASTICPRFGVSPIKEAFAFTAFYLYVPCKIIFLRNKTFAYSKNFFYLCTAKKHKTLKIKHL